MRQIKLEKIIINGFIVIIEKEHKERKFDHYWQSELLFTPNYYVTFFEYHNPKNPLYSISNHYYDITYSGQIYNSQELLNKYPYPASSTFLSEFLKHLYRKTGPKFLKEMNGDLAGVIYDNKADEFFIFRDRLGAKPLYYSFTKEKFIFSSHLPELLQCIDRPTISSQAIADFLHLGYIPEPLTFYEGVYKFPAGAYGYLRHGKLDIKTYWRAEDCIKASVESNEKSVLAQTEEILRDAIAIRLNEELSYGTFLSGGTDSGLVSAIAADLSPMPLKVFNASFEDAVFDEQVYAEQMAEIIHANYHHLSISKQDVREVWREGLQAVGEPFVDSSIFPTLLVSQFAQSHVEMIFSGDGGDELFMGYGAYTWADRLNNTFINNNRKLIAFLLRLLGGSRRLRAAGVFDYHKNDSLYSHIFSQEQNLFSAREVEEIIKLLPKHYAHPPNLNRELTPAEQQALFDMKYYLKDDLLVKVERSAAQSGLDVRLPFLDHRLVEYALNIDPALKRKKGEQKYILKKIMERYYPPELIYRKKWGFSIPLEKWMKENSGFSNIKIHPEFKSVFNDLNKQFKKSENHGYLYNRLYLLNILSRFYK